MYQLFGFILAIWFLSKTKKNKNLRVKLFITVSILKLLLRSLENGVWT